MDRILCILVGLALIAWGLYAQGWLAAIGLLPLATGLLNRCPMYLPFGLSSRKAAKAPCPLTSPGSAQPSANLVQTAAVRSSRPAR